MFAFWVQYVFKYSIFLGILCVSAFAQIANIPNAEYDPDIILRNGWKNFKAGCRMGMNIIMNHTLSV